MATLILGTVGTALFGPLGGAIGAFVGQQADNALFGSQGREGPRLNDLRLQTSSYGTPIPKIFGKMRVAGTIVWATDLQEDRHREGGGKGQPGTTTYSYSASFAVALSARPIRAVHRIWADGKLMRGIAGDFKSETGFRLYLGDEDQMVDPLIASAEGGGGTPAYRGVALAVFENCQLADFGNRIPSLTFEIEADDDPVSVVSLVDELSVGQVTADSGATLSGYAGHGSTMRGAFETLIAALPHHRKEDGEGLHYSDRLPAAIMLEEDALGARQGTLGAARYEMERQGSDKATGEILLRYYEPERDYQTGLQRAWIEGSGKAADRIDFPATLSAARAKGIAEARLETIFAEQASATITLPWSHMTHRPGDSLRIPGQSTLWRVTGFGLERMAVSLNLVRVGTAGTEIADSASAGRIVSDPDLEQGPTALQLLDLPALDDSLHASPRLLIAAAGLSSGWRSAALEISFDGGASFDSIGRTAPPAIFGTALNVPAAGQSAVFDLGSIIEVELHHDDMWLVSASDDALVAGTNLALLGDELLQFASVEALGENRFRLSRLLRGRRGSEWAMAIHGLGERFVLLDAATLKSLDAPVSTIGGTAELLATGLGDSESPASVQMNVAGRSVRPPPPVHLNAHREVDGAIQFTWVRRSRIGWAWISGSDAPLGEEVERWRITIDPASGQSRTVETNHSSYNYSAADQLVDGSESAGGFSLSIVQLGVHAESDPPARATFTL